MASLLPPNASALERAVESAINGNIEAVSVPVRDLWNPEKCPVALLPWLAWALSVDEWDSEWSEDQKRQSIADSVVIHASKGTLGSVRRVLAAAGYGDAIIIEGIDAERYDSAITYNGDYVHGNGDPEWAMYRVYLSRPITIAQAAQVRRILAMTAPTRSHLAGLHYDEALNLYDSAIYYDGTYSHGVA